MKWSKPIKSYHGTSQYQSLFMGSPVMIYTPWDRVLHRLYVSQYQRQLRLLWWCPKRSEKLLLMCLPGWILASYCLNTPWHMIKEKRRTKLWRTVQRKRACKGNFATSDTLTCTFQWRGRGKIYNNNRFCQGECFLEILFYIVHYSEGKKKEWEREGRSVCIDRDWRPREPFSSLR